MFDFIDIFIGQCTHRKQPYCNLSLSTRAYIIIDAITYIDFFIIISMSFSNKEN